MWCPRCHTEVAAEIAQNGQSLLCTSCGTEIQRIYAPSLHPDTRSARELLERWSKADLLDVASAEAPRTGGDVSPAIAPTIVASASPEPAQPVESIPLAASVASLAPKLPPAATPPVVSSETAAVDGPASETASRRDRPERAKPERPTPKPRTVWRVDAAHNVTQPVAPPPPPVSPRRPHFTALVGDEGAKLSPLVPPESEARSVEAADPSDSEPVERFEPVRPRAIERDEAESVEPPRRARRPEPVAPRSAALERATPTKVLQRRLDPAHESLGGPHFDLQAFLAQDGRKPGKSESIWGQVLAYAGVGLITIGTTLVLWGWFGNKPQYAPTGWLVCTVGQMLLFLGVITLISGGMQQTSHEVTRRVEYLGDRILRFEHSADEILRGPHFNELRDRAKGKTRQTVEADDGEFDA